MSRFLNEQYLSLEAYTPGEQPRDMQYIKLNTNESPYPPSEGVLKAVNEAEVKNLRLYSDPEAKGLKTKIAELYGVEPENVFISNGSDEILSFSFMAFFAADKPVIFPNISYGFYKVYGDLYGIDYTEAPLKDDFTIDTDDYIAKNKNIVIANPNAPTGIALSIGEVEEIIKSNPDNLVLIDEAYVDFGGESCVELTKKYDNLLVVQTYSKSRAMAGARLGFGIANKEIIADLEKIKYSTNPYNVNRLSQIAGAAAIDDNDYYMANCRKIIEDREYTTKCLEDMGFTVLPSKANFIFAKSDKISGEKLYKELKARGILVRWFSKPIIKDFVRITIGTREQMDTFIENVKQLVLTEE